MSNQAIHWLLALALVASFATSMAQTQGDDEEFEEEEEISTDVPDFISTSDTVTVAQGRRLKLVCQVNDLGGTVLMWMKDESQMLRIGHNTISQDTRYQFRVLPDNTGMTLTLEPVEFSDASKYFCSLATTPIKKIEFDVKVVDPSELTNEIDEVEPESEAAENKPEDTSAASRTANSLGLLCCTLIVGLAHHWRS